MKYQLHTFGCKVNTYDSGLIQKNLLRSGFALEQKKREETNAESSIHVLNTCAVTGEATKEAVRLIRRIKAKNPLATVVITGCAAQVDTGAFENLPGADLVVANSHKGMLPQLLEQYFKGTLTQKVFKSNIFQKDDLEAGGGEEQLHTRSFLKIQDGCNSFCTYCVIPFARGKSRSISIFDLVTKVNTLYAQGVREVVLTGVHIGDYEDEVAGSRKNLSDLVATLLAKTKIPRFRLSSLEPVELTDSLMELYQDPRMCPHFHMSIQSANTEVLKQMKRHYGQAEVIEALRKIEKMVPNAFVGMDVIAGFPTETDEQFEDTYQALADLPWTRLHVFPYSERPGTYAARLVEAVPWETRVHRAGQLRNLSLHRYQIEAQKQIGLTKSVLVLKSKARGVQGLSHDYWPVQLPENMGMGVLAGTEVPMTMRGFEMGSNKSDGYLVGME